MLVFSLYFICMAWPIPVLCLFKK